MKRYLAPVGWALGMLVLILDGKTAISGTAEGLQLCLHTLIPSLFPFFVLSAMLTSSLPRGGLLLAGILGGYPAGAENVARALRNGQLDRREASRMVVLCNCAGPSFIFGVIGPVLGSAGKAFLVWISYLVSVLSLWLIFPKPTPTVFRPAPMNLQQALRASVRAMAGVCGWVILFRGLLAVLDRWVFWLLPQWSRTALYGILELSGGCLLLQELEPGLAVILAAGFVGFGGICVMLQTASVAGDVDLRCYFPGKIFQSMISMAAASMLYPQAVTPPVQAVWVLASAFLALHLRKIEKRYGNRRQIIV